MFKLNKIVKSLGFIFGVITLSFGLGYVVLAWSEPVSAPPECTAGTPGCDAPINVGGVGQIKSGNLQVNALSTGTLSGNALLVPNGNVGIGTTAPGAKLEVKGDVLFSGTVQGNTGGINIPTSDMIVGGGSDGLFAVRTYDVADRIIAFGNYNSLGTDDFPFAMKINTTSGNVGIGVGGSTSEVRLEIKGDLRLIPASLPYHNCIQDIKGTMYYRADAIISALCICDGDRYRKVADGTNCF